MVRFWTSGWPAFAVPMDATPAVTSAIAARAVIAPYFMSSSILSGAGLCPAAGLGFTLALYAWRRLSTAKAHRNSGNLLKGYCLVRGGAMRSPCLLGTCATPAVGGLRLGELNRPSR